VVWCDVAMPTTTTNPETIPVRLSRPLVEQIRKIAEANERSLAAEMRIAMREHVARAGVERKKRGK
jgi:hypothetical protein